MLYNYVQCSCLLSVPYLFFAAVVDSQRCSNTLDQRMPSPCWCLLSLNIRSSSTHYGLQCWPASLKLWCLWVAAFSGYVTVCYHQAGLNWRLTLMTKCSSCCSPLLCFYHQWLWTRLFSSETESKKKQQKPTFHLTQWLPALPSFSSDDLPIPLAVPIYSTVPPGLGWCFERPLSIHCRSGLSLFWSVWPPTWRYLRWSGHKHHLSVSTKSPTGFPLLLMTGIKSLLQNSVWLWCLIMLGVVLLDILLSSVGLAIHALYLQLQAQCFFLSCISFPDITARSGILTLEDRLCPVNGYFCSVRLV